MLQIRRPTITLIEPEASNAEPPLLEPAAGRLGMPHVRRIVKGFRTAHSRRVGKMA